MKPEQETLCLLHDPFESDKDDVAVRKLRDAFVAARKAYKCAICLGVIARGERHRSIVEVDDAAVASFRICHDCCVAIVAYEESHYTEAAEDALEKRYALGQERSRLRYDSTREQINAHSS